MNLVFCSGGTLTSGRGSASRFLLLLTIADVMNDALVERVTWVQQETGNRGPRFSRWSPQRLYRGFYRIGLGASGSRIQRRQMCEYVRNVLRSTHALA